jgi:diacylglycerol kinase (ATP)
VAAVAAVTLGFLFGITPGEWTAVVIVIAMVFSAEAVNSAIERTADFVKAERDDRNRDIKDLAAGAVLVCAVGAAVVGVIIFLPYLITFINSLI